MSYTPYPDGKDEYENPCIAVSNDLVNWEAVPACQPLDSPSEGYNSDSHLVYNEESDSLELWWRYVYDESDPEQMMLRRSITEDGETWSAPDNVLVSDNRSDTDYVSPSIIKDGSVYRMWYVSKRGLWYTESSDCTNWSDPVRVSCKAVDSSVIWHADVIKTDSGFELLTVNHRQDAQDHLGMSLYHGTSTDGMSFEDLKVVIRPGVGTSWDAAGLYRSTFTKDSDGMYTLVYSGIGLDGTRGIGLTVFNSLPD